MNRKRTLNLEAKSWPSVLTTLGLFELNTLYHHVPYVNRNFLCRRVRVESEIHLVSQGAPPTRVDRARSVARYANNLKLLNFETDRDPPPRAETGRARPPRVLRKRS